MASQVQGMARDFLPAELTVEAAVKLADLTVYRVSGIFDNGFERAEVGTLGVESTGPTFTAATADLPGIAQGDTLRIEYDVYTIRDVEPDGEGITELVLHAN